MKVVSSIYATYLGTKNTSKPLLSPVDVDRISSTPKLGIKGVKSMIGTS